MKSHDKDCSRRHFLKGTSAGLAALTGLPIIHGCSSEESAMGPQKKSTPALQTANNAQTTRVTETGMPTRTLGKTGLEISMLSFGGGSQFMANDDGDWEPLLEQAVASGVNYFDTASSYKRVIDNVTYYSESRFGQILNQYRDQVYIGTKLDKRESEDAKTEFENSMTRLNMDYVDILLMHAIRKRDDLSTIENGVHKEMLQWKSEGKVKYIGLSVMQEADLVRAEEIINNLEIDVVVGVFNASPSGQYGNTKPLLPLLKEKNIGFMGIKIVRNMIGENKVGTVEELINYVLDYDPHFASAIIGHHGIEKLTENTAIVQNYNTNTSITRRDWSALEKRAETYFARNTPIWHQAWYRDGMMV